AEEMPAPEVAVNIELPAEVALSVNIRESAAQPAIQEAVAENRSLGDEEVTAALASLAPASGNGDAPDEEPAKWGVAARDQASLSMAAAVGQGFSGPRWIAEPVSVMEDEATVALEQEMERAY